MNGSVIRSSRMNASADTGTRSRVLHPVQAPPYRAPPRQRLRPHLWTVVTSLLTLTGPIFAHAEHSSLGPAEMAELDFEQRLGHELPGDLTVTRADGRRVELRGLFQDRPVIWVFGYYECPMLCNLVLNDLTETLLRMESRVGEDFDVAMLSIDPNETPELATQKKRSYLRRYGRSTAGRGWHFLTATEPVIRTLTHTAGFDYRYDPELDQYAHPGGLIVLTPRGKIAQYLFGVDYDPETLQDAIRSAARRQVSSPARRLLLLCFQYNPLEGKYSALIFTGLRITALGTLLALAILLIRLARSSPRRADQPGQAQSTQTE